MDSWGFTVHDLAKELERRTAQRDALLEALEFLLADYIAIEGPLHTMSYVPLNKARAAIAQAKGETA